VAYVFAMTIPGLAIALIVLGAVDVALFRRRGRRIFGSRRRSGAAPVAYDEAAALFTPGKRLELEQRQSASLLRETPDDGAPAATAIDLIAGTARIMPASPAVQGLPGPPRAPVPGLQPPQAG
jgi:hypothetical protein